MELLFIIHLSNNISLTRFDHVHQLYTVQRTFFRNFCITEWYILAKPFPSISLTTAEYILLYVVNNV